MVFAFNIRGTRIICHEWASSNIGHRRPHRTPKEHNFNSVETFDRTSGVFSNALLNMLSWRLEVIWLCFALFLRSLWTPVFLATGVTVCSDLKGAMVETVLGASNED